MVRFFTVRWPHLARLEAYLLFGAVLKICGRSATLRLALNPWLAVLTRDLGAPPVLLFWAALAVLTASPFFFGMVLVDRLLTVRKGFAVLSLLSVPVWASVAAALCNDRSTLVPVARNQGMGDMPIALKAAIFAGSLSLLIHGRSLWIGLADRGFVGLRLKARSATSEDRPRGGWNFWSIGATNSDTWLAPNPRGRTERGTGRGRGSTFRAMLIWSVVFAAVMAGTVAYRDARSANPRVEALPAPLPRVWSEGDEASAPRRNDGHFVFDAFVNGRMTSMLFDTGASFVTLRAEDAVRLGVPVDKLNFSIKVATANGIGLVAATTIDTLTVGAITQRGVPAFVAKPGALRENLLGQSFLKNLRQYKVEDDYLVFKSH
jgi:aspartyl protease family protein